MAHSQVIKKFDIINNNNKYDCSLKLYLSVHTLQATLFAVMYSKVILRYREQLIPVMLM